jgi:hypothetical protein
MKSEGYEQIMNSNVFLKGALYSDVARQVDNTFYVFLTKQGLQNSKNNTFILQR